MMNPLLEQELRSHLELLAPDQQWQILEFARTLAASPLRIKGVPGPALLRFAGTILPDDLAAMVAVIEADCEQVDPQGVQWRR